MDPESFVNSVMAGIVLLFLAAVSALLLKRLRFPYTVGLVLLGLVLAFLTDEIPAIGESIEDFELAPELILFVFIPILVFESAFNTDVRLLSRNLAPTLTLAVPGLLLSTAAIGFATHWAIGLPLGSAMVLGALVSATDPVAVIALFKEIGAPRRLTVLVEGESLFNDATAIVTYQIILAVIATGVFDATVVTDGILDFLAIFFGGLIVGLGVGYVLALSIRSIGDEPLVQIALTMVVAYLSFIVAEHFLHTSGIMALLGSGLVVGYHGSALYSERVREYLEIVWDNLAFVANSFIFLLLGLSERTLVSNVFDNVAGLLVPMLVVIAIVLAVRVVLVFGLIGALNRLPGSRPISRAYQAVMAWGGLRGAIAVALALSLPRTFPFRWQIIDITFGIVLFTLLVNGTTMRWLLTRLGLDRPSPIVALLGSYGDAVAKQQALTNVDGHLRPNHVGPAATARVREELSADVAVAAKRCRAIREELGDSVVTRRRLAWLRAIGIQREVYRRRFADGLLGLRSLRELEWDLRQLEAEVLATDDRPVSVLASRLVDDGATVLLDRLAGRRVRAARLERTYQEVSATLAAATAVRGDRSARRVRRRHRRRRRLLP